MTTTTLQELKNKQLIRSNVINSELSKQLIQGTLEDIANILAKTLGPYGSTTIIEDRMVNHTISKDGYTLLNKIRYEGEVPPTTHELVKSVSRSLVREVGDGSTSSIVISNALLKNLNKGQLIKQLPSKEVLDYLSAIEEYLTDAILERSIAITDKNFDVIKNIASIANNNDDKAGDLIYNLYKEIGKDGFINLEKSPIEEDSYEISKGVELPRGYIHNIFANTSNKIDYSVEKPFIFLCNDVLTEEDQTLVAELLGIALSNAKPLVFIAKGYSSEIANMLKINNNSARDTLQIADTDYAFVNKNHFDSFDDLALYLNATVYDKYNNNPISDDKNDLMKMLGMAEKVIMDDSTTKLIGGWANADKIKERIELIDEFIIDVKSQDKARDIEKDLYNLQKRKANLGCKTATLYVGGNSEIEKETRMYLMEDAIYACRSAIKHGYISGGNLVIPKIISQNSTDIATFLAAKDINKSISEDDLYLILLELIDILFESFAESFRTVLRNINSELVDDTFIYNTINKCIADSSFFNIKSHRYESDLDTKVINSAMTDIQIMKASFSIVGLMYTSNQFIASSVRDYDMN